MQTDGEHIRTHRDQGQHGDQRGEVVCKGAVRKENPCPNASRNTDERADHPVPQLLASAGAPADE